MKKFIFRRIITALITLWIIITLTFVLMHAIPGGPFSNKKKKLPPVVIEALENKYHLNDPLIKQYFDYIGGVLRFDFGPSFKFEGMSVNDMLKKGFPISARFGILAFLLSFLIGIPLGIISALRAGHWEDRVITVFITLGMCIPGFILATVLMYVFSYKLGWLPVYGIHNWKSYLMPVITMTIGEVTSIARILRSSILEVLDQDYVLMARSKGLPEYKVIIKHVFRNALIPIVTMVGPMLTGILTGSFTAEKIFNIPGMGRFFIEGIGNRDYTLIMGITIFTTVLLLIGVTASDIMYGLVYPRITIDNLESK